MLLVGEVLAWTAVVIGTVNSVPQLIRSYSTESVDDLEPISMWLGLLSTVMWIVYGFMDVANRLQLTVSSCIRLALSVALLVCYYKYSKKKRRWPWSSWVTDPVSAQCQTFKISLLPQPT